MLSKGFTLQGEHGQWCTSFQAIVENAPVDPVPPSPPSPPQALSSIQLRPSFQQERRNSPQDPFGIHLEDPGSGVCCGDYTGDGLLDCFIFNAAQDFGLGLEGGSGDNGYEGVFLHNIGTKRVPVFRPVRLNGFPTVGVTYIANPECVDVDVSHPKPTHEA